jgi:hypothetical protein
MSEELARYIPVIIVCVILIRRTQRPRVLRPSRLWIRPAILLAAAAAYTFAAIRSGPPVRALDAAIIAGTAALGVALGTLRAHSMTLTKHPDTGAIEAKLTLWGLAVVLVWIGGRVVLHQTGVVGATDHFGVFTDAAVALAVATVSAQTVVLVRRCQALECGALRSPQPGNKQGHRPALGG